MRAECQMTSDQRRGIWVWNLHRLLLLISHLFSDAQASRSHIQKRYKPRRSIRIFYEQFYQAIPVGGFQHIENPDTTSAR